jgi:hypothetical protein
MDLRPLSFDDAPSSTQGGLAMGDKSPKAKEKAKKQDTAGKNDKKAAAAAKASQQGAAGGGKNKR